MYQCRTHICDQSVDEVGVDDEAVHAAKRDIEQKPCEGCMVPVTNTRVDPRAVVVHLQDTAAWDSKH